MTIHIILLLIIVDVIFSCLCLFTGTIQERIALMTCRIVPFLIALPALWGRKYWGWILGTIFAAYDTISVILFLLPNMLNNWPHYQRQFTERPIIATYDIIITHVFMLVVAVLLIIKRSEFNE